MQFLGSIIFHLTFTATPRSTCGVQEFFPTAAKNEGAYTYIWIYAGSLGSRPCDVGKVPRCALSIAMQVRRRVSRTAWIRHSCRCTCGSRKLPCRYSAALVAPVRQEGNRSAYIYMDLRWFAGISPVRCRKSAQVCSFHRHASQAPCLEDGLDTALLPMYVWLPQVAM